MARKIGFGFLWFVALYLGACMVIGGIAGSIAGNANPQQASAAGFNAGAAAVAPIRAYLAIGALVIAVIGAATGRLPGTKNADD